MRPNKARPRNHISRRTNLFPIPLRSGQNIPLRVAGVRVRVGVTLNSLFAVNWPAGNTGNGTRVVHGVRTPPLAKKKTKKDTYMRSCV